MQENEWKGHYDTQGLPCVSFHHRNQEHTGIVDTGFNGFAQLPFMYRDLSKPARSGYSSLADGMQSLTYFVEETITFADRSVTGLVQYPSGLGGSVLLGMGFLKQFKLKLIVSPLNYRVILRQDD